MIRAIPTPETRRPPSRTVTSVRQPRSPTARTDGLPRTQFLIPVWNDLLSVVLCLRTVLELADEVVLYDDGSTDGSTEYLEAVAKANSHVTLIRSDRQEGWTRARSTLFAYADPTQLRVWADADDLFVPALWPEFVENLNHCGVLCMGFYEVWGDHRHTTQFGLRGDYCHFALWPAERSHLGWSANQHGFDVPVLDRPAVLGPRCCFHLNGHKTDARLSVRGAKLLEVNRSPESAEKPTPPSFLGDVHRAAMSALFADPERTVVPMPQVLVEYLESQIPEQLRFTVAGNERFGNEHVVAELDRLRRSGFRGNADVRLGDAGRPRGPHGMTGEKGD
jgi:hypothetical protein